MTANVAASVKARLLAIARATGEEIGEQIIRFLGPVRGGILTGGPFDRRWPAGGPWEAAAFARSS